MSPQDIAEGTTTPHSAARITQPDTRLTGRSVDWSDTIEDQPTEEAVLQISGAGHWFLEEWIGDHTHGGLLGGLGVCGCHAILIRL